MRWEKRRTRGTETELSGDEKNEMGREKEAERKRQRDG